MQRKVTEVACGVLIDRVHGTFLLGSRPEGKPCAGFWEFPGGKLEVGETPAVALARELKEELGIEIGKSYPWFVMEHDYPHAYVRLHFRRCFTWRGELQGLEHQKFAWFSSVAALTGMKLLPMDELVSERIYLPDVVRATNPNDLATYEGLAKDGGVFVETAEEVRKAAEAGALYAVTRPGAEENVLAGEANTLPVYIFGVENDLESAREKGAHGLILLEG